MPYDPNTHHRRSIRLRGYDYSQAGVYFVTICTHGRARIFDDAALRQIAEEQWQALNSAGLRGASAGRVHADAWVVMPDHVHGIIVIGDVGGDDGVGDDGAGDDGAGDDGAGDDGAGDDGAGDDGVGDGGAGDGDDVGAQQPVMHRHWKRLLAAAPLRRPSHDAARDTSPRPSHDAARDTSPRPSHDAARDMPPRPSHDAARDMPPRSSHDTARDTPHDAGERVFADNVTPGSLGAIVRSYKSAVARRVNRRRRTPGAPVWQRGYYERIVRDERELHAVRRYIAENPQRHAARLDALLRRMQRKGNG